jgi:copper(I)-binding protein
MTPNPTDQESSMNIHRTTTHVTRIAIVLVVASMLALGACGSSTEDTAGSATTESPQPEVTITDAWARQSPAATTMGAAYMTLTSTVDDQLISASAPTSVAAKTELHETVEATTDTTGMGSDTTGMGSDTTGMGSDTTMGGSAEMKMQPVESIALPAGQAVELKPGGYHVMLIDLVEPLTAGQQITLTLTFARAGTQEVTVTVRES